MKYTIENGIYNEHIELFLGFIYVNCAKRTINDQLNCTPTCRWESERRERSIQYNRNSFVSCDRANRIQIANDK